MNQLFESELQAEMQEVGELKTVPAGAQIMDIGDTVRTMPFIQKGVVRIMREEEGREVLLYYVNPNESCAMTFTCCMQHKKSSIRAIAEEDVEMLVFPIRYMDAWMEHYPSWRKFVLETIQFRFEELLKSIDQIAFQKLDERLLHYLKKRSEVLDSRLLNVSHEQIANELATSRVVISRLLKKLENDGLVLLYRNQVKLLNKMFE